MQVERMEGASAGGAAAPGVARRTEPNACPICVVADGSLRRCVHVPVAGSCARALPGEKGLGRYTDFEMSSSWSICVGPKSNDKCH